MLDAIFDFIGAAIFYTIAAPFWLAWKLLRFLFAAVQKTNAEHRREVDIEPTVEAWGAKRRAQLDALTDQVPKNPPERMRAVFALNEFKVSEYKDVRVKRLFGDDDFESVLSALETQYSADMILEMNETERAIIRKHQLEDIVLEDVPLYSERELTEHRAQHEVEVEAATDPYLKIVRGQVNAQVEDNLKHKRLKTRVGDFLVSPYIRAFDTHREAQLHLNKLKTEYLPKIRELIEQYRDLNESQTLEF